MGDAIVLRVIIALLGLVLASSATQAEKRIALVIGQNSYPGGGLATVGLPPLDNPRLDARRMAELLARHGFDVIALVDAAASTRQRPKLLRDTSYGASQAPPWP